MHWFERKIRRYEHRRWTTDDNRRVQPFHWGLERIGGSPDDPDPTAFVREYARKALASGRGWYAGSPASASPLDRQNHPTFTRYIEACGVQTPAATATRSISRPTPSLASSAPASVPRSATSLSSTMNASAPAVSFTSPRTSPTSSARA